MTRTTRAERAAEAAAVERFAQPTAENAVARVETALQQLRALLPRLTPMALAGLTLQVGLVAERVEEQGGLLAVIGVEGAPPQPADAPAAS